MKVSDGHQNVILADLAQSPKERSHAVQLFHDVRAHSTRLTSRLSAEDQCLQSMPDASPSKWHLAHTTWFYEALLLRPFLAGYQPYDERFHYLFNSYYEALGPRLARPSRGLISRPDLDEVYAYRRHVDASMPELIESCPESAWHRVWRLLQLGLNHEQQHQELILTDILHAFSCNPFKPTYDPHYPYPAGTIPAVGASLLGDEHAWIDFPGGRVTVGAEPPLMPDQFCYDNEMGRHDVLLVPYSLATSLVTCADFAEFVADGGYRRPELWLADGWAAVQANGWEYPAYWIPGDSEWSLFGLSGVRPMNPVAPVMQLSFYEAAAYAEWAGARLPTEFEWEAAANDARLRQVTGHAWQWTRSSYSPYPRFQPLEGAPSEYNGKFMVGQLVLRGGSLATPPGHSRLTYRNFFPPGARWQFSGLRLAKDFPC